jgi:hypothetical protein
MPRAPPGKLMPVESTQYLEGKRAARKKNVAPMECRGSLVKLGAVERIRTFTVLLPPAPQAGASASSATTAKKTFSH